jgi:hypothetical protein
MVFLLYVTLFPTKLRRGRGLIEDITFVLFAFS